MPKRKSEEKERLRTGVIYCGDNLEVMQRLPPNSIDLIYIDPPFFSNRHYEVIWGNGAELRAFADRWMGGIKHYVNWLRERLMEMHRLLKPTGSIYVHLDWRAVHYIKCEMDRIFGIKNFRNEIIWHYSGWNKILKDHFENRNDSILFYGKGDEQIFFGCSIPWASEDEYVKVRKQKVRVDTDGRKYVLSDAGGGKRIKRYLADAMREGRPLDNVWDIDKINNSSKEFLGYPTQKPEALLERMIKASSSEGDVVADFFCGCGTTLAVAERLGRFWLGCDVSPTACKLVQRRVAKLIKGSRGIEIIGMPVTIDELKKMEPFEFQNHVIVDLLHGTCSRTKSADRGIDGHDFGHNPVEVKQSEGVGRPVVQKFHSAVLAERRTKGIIVAFSFSKTAHEEAARIKLEEGVEIELCTVQELIVDHYRRMGRNTQ
jgi:DNA modification methylase